MSQANVDLLRKVFALYEREGVGAGIEYFAEDVVWNAADEAPQHGPDEVIAYMQRWESEWEELRTVVEELLDAGDKVLATVHFSGRGRASGIEVDARMYEVYELRGGKIVRMDEFGDLAQAREVAGLP
jgi:uncharacterized protein